ncbi:MAG: dihydrofolate reductase family protein [Solirubrobacteraceae bacterium]
MGFAHLLPPAPDETAEVIFADVDFEAHAPAQRPYVICNFVASADGKATVAGRSSALGGSEGDRITFHLLRTRVGAILAGTETMRIERYGRLLREDRLADLHVGSERQRRGQPLAVLISRSGAIPFEIPLFDDPESRIALYTAAEVDLPAHVRAAVYPHQLGFGWSGELAAVLRSLRSDHGVRSLLCEGGPTLFGALLAEDCVDELFLTLAPALAGAGERGVTAGPPLTGALQLKLIWVLERDGYLFLRYARRRHEQEGVVSAASSRRWPRRPGS